MSTLQPLIITYKSIHSVFTLLCCLLLPLKLTVSTTGIFPSAETQLWVSATCALAKGEKAVPKAWVEGLIYCPVSGFSPTYTSFVAAYIRLSASLAGGSNMQSQNHRIVWVERDLKYCRQRVLLLDQFTQSPIQTYLEPCGTSTTFLGSVFDLWPPS